jgi:adenosylhomocysteine nucleosidase
MGSNTVVMLSALNLEYEAVRRRLTNPQIHHHAKGTLFEIGGLPGSDGRVALGLTSKGNHSAAVLAERAIQHFSPVALIFVGVAGGLWETTALGDVVMATQVYAYHGGTSEDDGLKARPRSWEVPHDIGQLAAHLARTGDWADRVDGPASSVHFGPIAAGEIVQNSSVSREAMWIRQVYNDALAIEMEGAGVAQAGHLNSAAVAVVRGISDRADGTKTTDEDRAWQPAAADNAAAFAVRLAEELVTKRKGTAMADEDTIGNAERTTNIAFGQVGVQAGHITNSTVSVGQSAPHPESEDLGSMLAALHKDLLSERSAGRIDDATYHAAQQELETAEASLDEATPEAGNAVILALKRLRGLLGDVAALAARVARIITVAQGTS